MSDQKKPRINLKDRLGKGGGAAPAGGGAIPAPIVPGAAGVTPPPPGVADGQRDSTLPRDSGVPRDSGLPAAPVIAPPPSIKPSGIAPPPGVLGGINLPSFQPRAAPKKEVVSAEAQTIKVEVGEEVIAQRRKGIRNVIIGAVVAAAAGFGIGMVAGGGRADSAYKAAEKSAAVSLKEPVKNTMAALNQLADVLGKSNPASVGDDLDGLDRQIYPAELEEKLSKIIIPFGDKDIDGKQLPKSVLSVVIKFKSICDDINTEKSDLKNMVGGLEPPQPGVKDRKALKDALPAMWELLKTKPPYTQAVVLRGGSDKLVAELNPLKAELANDAKWPDALAVMTKKKNNQGGYDEKEESFNRFTGKIEGEKPLSILVYPGDARSRETVDAIVRGLKSQAQAIKNLLYGIDAPEGTGLSTRGILSRGEGAEGIGDELLKGLDQIERTQKN